MSELPPSGAALDKLLAGGGEAELRRRYAADLHAAGLGVPSRRLESSACSARGVRGSGVENSAKKRQKRPTWDPQLGYEKNTVILVFRS